ncbi:TetR/AcrR family transcriptional regulator [Microbacterium lacticum]
MDSSRPYRSALRSAQAAQTRHRVLDAAARLFATRGYHATTFAAIAAEAGVSAETVKAGGSKSALLIAAFEMRFAGTESAPSLTDTEAGAGLMDLPDDLVLDAIVERTVAANARAYALWTVLLAQRERTNWSPTRSRRCSPGAERITADSSPSSLGGASSRLRETPTRWPTSCPSSCRRRDTSSSSPRADGSPTGTGAGSATR